MNLNMLRETFRQALRSIAGNKFRTLLTMLGIMSSSLWAWATE